VTLHIVPAEEYPMYFKATRDAMGRFLRSRGYSWPPKLTKTHEAILDFIDERRDATTVEIREHLEARGLPVTNLHRTIHYELGGIGAILRSERTPKVPTQWKWSTTERMIGKSALESVTEEEAKEWLVQKYLKAFGPSSIDDITSYTWHTKTETKKIIEKLAGKGEIANIKIGIGNQLWVLSQDIEKLRELKKENRTGEKRNLIRVLPEFDPLTVGLRRRWKTLIAVPPVRLGLRPHPAPGIILVNGQISGKYLTWPGLSLFLDAREKEPTMIKAIVEKLEDMARLRQIQVLCIRKIDGEEGTFVESKPILDCLLKAGYSLCQEGLCKQLS